MEQVNVELEALILYVLSYRIKSSSFVRLSSPMWSCNETVPPHAVPVHLINQIYTCF